MPEAKAVQAVGSAGEALERLPQLVAVGLGRPDRRAARDHAEGRGQLGFLRELEQRRHDLAVREVAGGAEQHERARIRWARRYAGRAAGCRDVERRFHGVCGAA